MTLKKSFIKSFYKLTLTEWKIRLNQFQKYLIFFKKLDTYKNNKIFIYTDKSNALDAAKIYDQRIYQISKIDGKLFAIKPNIKYENPKLIIESLKDEVLSLF